MFVPKKDFIFERMINLQLAKAFLRHRFSAKTRHGVHSPFVYRLVDEVIYDFKSKKGFEKIENLRAQLLQDERIITITDLGAGSHVNNSRQKKVRQLAKNALKPAKLAQLIYRIVNDQQPQNIIELGTCLGITSAYLAEAAPRANIITVEGCPETAKIAQENLEKLGAGEVKVLVGNFDKVLPDILNGLSTVDFLFIDGNHRKDATLNYFKQALPLIRDNSIVVFDDIYWSKGMEEAWEEVKNHPQVSVTIDLFWIGVVFFRKGQAKEHFKIKY